MRPTRSQNVAVSTTAAATPSATPTGISAIRIATTVDTYVLFHPSAVATTSTGMLIRASTSGEVFTIAPGDFVSGITSSGTGVMSVSELSA